MINEPAFPRPFSWDESPSGIHSGDRVECHPEQSGMSLRDYFAAAALQGMIAQRGYMFGQTGNWGPEWSAQGAYAMADAMLAERSKARREQ